jgi:hypothetical protein
MRKQAEHGDIFVSVGEGGYAVIHDSDLEAID